VSQDERTSIMKSLAFNIKDMKKLEANPASLGGTAPISICAINVVTIKRTKVRMLKWSFHCTLCVADFVLPPKTLFGDLYYKKPHKINTTITRNHKQI
jgi:hypothetical protein